MENADEVNRMIDLHDRLCELNCKIAQKIAEKQGLGPRCDFDLEKELVAVFDEACLVLA